MTIDAPQMIRALRAFFWIAPFYIVALVIKIYTIQRPAIGQSIHILTFAIISGAFCVLAILYQTRDEISAQKHWKHLFSASLLTGLIYGLCCLLSYALSGSWEFLYL
jgi:hypothetical protein